MSKHLIEITISADALQLLCRALGIAIKAVETREKGRKLPPCHESIGPHLIKMKKTFDEFLPEKNKEPRPSSATK